MQDTVKKYPDISKLEIIGYSVEKRPIYAIQITGKVNSSFNKAATLIMGLHHARGMDFC